MVFRAYMSASARVMVVFGESEPADMVMYGFEVVEINEDHGGAAVGARHPRNRPSQLALEAPPVRNVEQRIGFDHRFKMFYLRVRGGKLGLEHPHAALNPSRGKHSIVPTRASRDGDNTAA